MWCEMLCREWREGKALHPVRVYLIYVGAVVCFDGGCVEEDAAEIVICRREALYPEAFGLTSIRKAVTRYLHEAR